MAVDAARHVRRGRVQDARLAKERRQKIFLALGSLLLLVLLVIQLPGLLGGLRGSSAPEPAGQTAGTTVGNPGPSEAAKRTRFRVRVAALNAFPAADPFVQQIATGSATKSSIGSRGAPRVRASHFVVKDPFEDQISSAPASPPVAGAKPPASGKTDGNGAYVVILASVPVPQGMAAARRVAQIARARGLKGAGVLTSASFPALRPGFYVVYGGTYKSMRAAVRGLEGARTLGFFTAYPRLLGG